MMAHFTGKKGAKADAVAYRREVVASARLRGLSLRAIVASLPKQNPPVVRPDGKPYTLATIKRDLDALREQWRCDASRDISEHLEEELAELKEMKKLAWARRDAEGRANPDLHMVMQAHDRIARLLGTNAPERQDIKAEVVARPGLPEETRAALGPERLKALADEILERRRLADVSGDDSGE